MKLEFSRQNFEKSQISKFHENLPSGRRVVPCGQAVERTDGHINSRVSQFCERG